MTTRYHLPIQKRALGSTKELEAYFKSQGIAHDKDSLPSMAQIVDYCERYPRLLRVRDSVLKNLHDPGAPPHIVHNYYVESALDYLEGSMFVLKEHWETDYRKKRHDKRQLASLFSTLVKDIHRCHTDTLLALKIPFPEGSALGAVELKKRVIQANLALIQENITPSFIEIRHLFYSIALEHVEAWLRYKPESFGSLFSAHVAKYEPNQMEHYAQLILDKNTLKLYDVFHLPADILDEACQQPPVKRQLQHIWMEEATYTGMTRQQLEEEIREFAFICDCLDELGLIPNWMEILKPKIKSRLAYSKWKGCRDISMIDLQLTWLHALVLPWLSHVMPHSEDIDQNWYSFLRIKIKAEHLLYEMIYKDRIPFLFDIIREYPQTLKAIEDFHMVAFKRGLMGDLKDRLIEELQTRLLHQGTPAMEILQQYIACIQSLSIIDPSCSIMQPVIDVVSDYVNHCRNDIVQGVVTMIRNAEENKLLHREDEVIYRFKPSELYDQEIPSGTVVIQEDTTALWRRLQRKSKDPIVMLISLCGSLKEFIKGYSNTLGQVLLETNGYDIDEEVRRLEILKQNFPPDAFHRCDVMLRDMSESRRLDRAIHENDKVNPTFHAIIMSRKYWPGGDDSDGDDSDEEQDEEVDLMWPGQADCIDVYDEVYQQTKPHRRLKFMNQKGSVMLELAFASKTIRVQASPDAALVIRLFETKANQFTSEDVAHQLGLSKMRVVEALKFWIKQQVLSLTGSGYYSLVEE